MPHGRTSACPAAWPTGRSPAIPWKSGTTPTSCWPRSPRRASPLTDIQVLRTDRGGGFAGERMERMLAEFGITRSLSRPGSPYDNAVVESTDRLIRKELMYDNVCTSVERLRSDLNRYVWWYDHQRLHSTLDYMSPVEFTQQGKTLQEQSNTPLPIHALVVPSNLHMMKNLGNTLLCRPLCRRLYSGRQR